MCASSLKLRDVAALFLFILACLLFIGCTTHPSDPAQNEPDHNQQVNGNPVVVDNANQSGHPNSPVLLNSELDETLQGMAYPDPIVSNEPPIYSSQLITQAYQGGSIDEDAYYLQLSAASFDPQQLDEAFAGEPDRALDATSLLRMIRLRKSSFSEDTQEQLAPYTLSFDNPLSHWHHPDQERSERVLQSSDQNRGVCAMERPMADGRYFDVSGAPGTESQQAIVLDALEYSWDVFSSLGLAEPTDWIRVSIVRDILNASGRREEDTLGVEYMANINPEDTHERCHIQIRSDLNNDVMRSITAHELFHCFQDYTEPRDRTPSGPWLWESTAVWAEEFAYPDINREHDYDALRFRTLNGYFFDLGGTLEYASYLYWFYLHQKDGKSGEAVKVLFEDMYRRGEQTVLMERPTFYWELMEYAMWNLNADPFKYYEDFNDEPTLQPHGDTTTSHHRLTAGEIHDESIFVAEGGIRYCFYTFDDVIDRVHFDLTQIKKQDDNQSAVQVVYRIGNEWHYEDISHRDELVFCRSRQREEVTGLILIVSNAKLDLSQPDSAISGIMTVDCTEECAPTWHGYAECRWNRRGPGDGYGNDYFLVGEYEEFGTTRVEEVLIYNSEYDVFYTIQDTVNTSSRYQWFFPHIPPTSPLSYTAWERKVENKSGCRTQTYEVPDGCPPDHCSGLPISIKPKSKEEPDVYVLRKRGYRDLGTYIQIYSAYHVAGPLGIMQGHVSEVRYSLHEHDIHAGCPWDELELTSSDDGRTLSGTHTTNTLTVEAHYTYD